MASITSVIFLFVLLATYCYSLPVEQKSPTSTLPKLNVESTTDKTLLDNAHTITINLMPDDETTVVPQVGQKFTDHIAPKSTVRSKDKDTTRIDDEHTTPATSVLPENVTRPPRLVGDMLNNLSPWTLTPEQPLPDNQLNVSHRNDSLFTTMETSTKTHETTTRSTTNTPIRKQETLLSTSVPAREFQTTEPTTSGDTFAKLTGLLTDDRTKTMKYTYTPTSTESKYKKTYKLKKNDDDDDDDDDDDRSDEESPFTISTVPIEELIKTISTLPDTIRQAKLFFNLPEQFSFLKRPNQQGLTQGQN